MKIKETMVNISANTFIEDYCKLKGIEDVESYLNPTWDNIEPHENYENIQLGFEMFDKYILTDATIGIVEDCDQDGTLSSTLSYNYIKATNPNQKIISYHHNTKIHGISDKKVLEQIKKDKPSLLIIPDAGSSDYSQCKELNDLGIDILILDHHHADVIMDLPNTVVINNQLSPKVKNIHGSGTVVAWHFFSFVDTCYGTMEALNFLDLCAFSLITDVCNCADIENRTILNYGFSHLYNPLLKALIDTFYESKIPNSDAIGWTISPKLNSLLRNDNPQDNLDLFTAFTQPTKIIQWQKGVRSKVENWSVLNKVIEQCSTSQKKQSDLVKKFMDEIEPTINPLDKVIISVVDESLGLSPSYTGLVSGKISDKFGKPCILLRENIKGKYTGSLRSSIPMREILDNSEYFKASGHSMACGVFIDADKLNVAKQWINTLDMSSEREYEVVKSYTYNSIPSDLFSTIVSYTDLYCKGFEKPLFHIKPFTISNSCIKKLKGQTMKINLNGISCMKFMCSNKIFEEFHTDEDEIQLEVELIVELSVNEWNGYVNNQFIIKDYSVKEKITNLINDDDYDVDEYF